MPDLTLNAKPVSSAQKVFARGAYKSRNVSLAEEFGWTERKLSHGLSLSNYVKKDPKNQLS